jgi:hypothetical protein|tara:strand:+ start:95 stop:652 length:558 start_codon:yes stop_codon:yes gene_type:complete
MRNILYEPVKHYYNILSSYSKTADRHMDGFTDIFRDSIPNQFYVGEKHSANIKGTCLDKNWDIAYGDRNAFKSAMEMKSIVMSQWGCWNSRKEEAVGVATDLRHVNKDIALSYFLVVEDGGVTTEMNRYRSYQLSDFCNCLEKKLKLYNNVCCIIINDRALMEEDKVRIEYAYSDFDTFLSKWSG